MADIVVVEFTIEPFVDGDPPPHVAAAIAAVEALGVVVEIGPFGSSFSADVATAAAALEALTTAAYANGATHVVVNTERNA